MTRDEIVKKLNTRMKAFCKNLTVIDDGDLTLQYDGLPQAWFKEFIYIEFFISDYEYLNSYLEHSEALVQFYVYGQKLLEELDCLSG